MLRRNGPVVKSVESVLRLEGSLWWQHQTNKSCPCRWIFMQAMFACYCLPHSYSMGLIINSVCLCNSVCVCVCVCVCVSVCGHSHGRISWSIFAKSGTELTTPKSKNQFVGGQHRTTLHHLFCSLPKNAILGQMVLKIRANINIQISTLNVRESL